MTDFELMGAALDEARKAAHWAKCRWGLWWPATADRGGGPQHPRDGKERPASCRAAGHRRGLQGVGRRRLWECELFVTLEPCPMCAGAILNSRIRPGGVRRGRCQGRVLRQCDGPVCPAVQPPPDGGAGPAGRGSRSTAAGVFQGSAGAAGRSAEVETARTARREYEETR